MKHPLDDFKSLNTIDPQGMLKTIERFPADCIRAYQNTEKLDLSSIKEPSSIVISGMGGSAIGGLLLQDWLHDISKIPIIVSRGPQLPGFIDSKTLVIGVSYSGNTEETLNSIQQSTRKKAQIITVTSGGKLLQVSKEEGYPYIKLPLGFQPRAALPYQLFSLIQIAGKLGVFEDKLNEIDDAIKTLSLLVDKYNCSVPIKDNPAKEIADKIMGHIPFIVTPGFMKSVGYRMSTQFNENSKIPAFASFFPEALHNRIMSVEANRNILEKIYPVIVRDSNEKKNGKKISAFRDLLREKFGKAMEIKTNGTENLAKMFSIILLGDFSSTYLGILYEKNPTPLESINFIKGVK
jgi:glucose/mannose-6-phosphate isomerase